MNESKWVEWMRLNSISALSGCEEYISDILYKMQSIHYLLYSGSQQKKSLFIHQQTGSDPHTVVPCEFVAAFVSSWEVFATLPAIPICTLIYPPDNYRVTFENDANVCTRETTLPHHSLSTVKSLICLTQLPHSVSLLNEVIPTMALSLFLNQDVINHSGSHSEKKNRFVLKRQLFPPRVFFKCSPLKMWIIFPYILPYAISR